MEALHWIPQENNIVECHLCPHYCKLSNGQSGICKVRKNRNGKLHSLNFAQISALHSDPVEKKPLYHFYPGSRILSVGSWGCNMSCNFCQNWEISQNPVPKTTKTLLSPTGLVAEANKIPGNIGLAFTYNEPTVFFEYMLESARLAASSGLKNVMVSNGYINPEPLIEVLPYMHAFNIDLKAFNDEFYRKNAGARLQAVLDSLRIISSSGRHLEITFLIIPGLNNNVQEFEKMLDFIRNYCGINTVLHLSRYFPRYKQVRTLTPASTLDDFYHRAKEVLNFVYAGNIYHPESVKTLCPQCGALLIDRSSKGSEICQAKIEGQDNYQIECSNCGYKLN